MAFVLALIAAVTFVVAAVLVVRSLGTDTHGAHVVRFTIKSPLVHQSLPVAAVVPPGASAGPRPLLVFLHGKGQDESTFLDDAMFAALARLGSRAPDIVFPYGGADSYWHTRASGAWGAYVLDEVIPEAIKRLGADPKRVAIGGVSMGGFGALDLARLSPRGFCAVGGHSAALWVSGAQTAAGAFDDARDFALNNVIGIARRGDPYRRMAVWVDVGSQDPFRAADTTFVDALRKHGQQVAFHEWPGGHDQAYWDSHWTDYLGFYAGALAACHH
ncbi:MAG TPA: alpha/beta hydrolase-fold protein [Solirubrobacteraceae bacterium]|nr:alpha/beta hydrolase-fold protein [Solirubrobacteraceae bacterium]